MDSPLQSFKFPRTGKRGVPQQFPRRLYEMLDGETKLLESSELHPKVIHWSVSGRAFRIADTNEFANCVLPKYFRTKKFSSFQRNLNLYGFTKVRRGPDTDMYAHPSFLKGQPELLLDLRKINGSSRSKKSKRDLVYDRRAVSPSPSHSTGSDMSSSPSLYSSPVQRYVKLVDGPPILSLPLQASPSLGDTSTTSTEDRGKLDLLAFALEQMD